MVAGEVLGEEDGRGLACAGRLALRVYSCCPFWGGVFLGFTKDFHLVPHDVGECGSVWKLPCNFVILLETQCGSLGTLVAFVDRALVGPLPGPFSSPAAHRGFKGPDEG